MYVPLEPYEPLEKESRLYSYDVVSLYTNIPHALGLEAIDYWINARPDLVPNRFPASFILEAAKIVLTNNNFMLTIECLPKYQAQPWEQSLHHHMHV